LDKRDLQLNDLRGGDVPPTLIGNSVLAIAGADPMRALSVLQTRLKPYLGWAKRADFVFEKALVEERNGIPTHTLRPVFGLRSILSTLGMPSTKTRLVPARIR